MNTLLHLKERCLLIAKKQRIPLRLLADLALLEHLPEDHPNRRAVEDDLAKLKAGWRGEQNLSYYLDMRNEDNVRIFYDLRLTLGQHVFQIDALLLTDTFALIMEVKNYSGMLQFEPGGEQMIRLISNRHEGFSNPVVQVKRHVEMLSKWLAARRLLQLPFESFVVIAFASTMFTNPGNIPEINEKVIHAELAALRIDILTKKYSRSRRNSALMTQIEQALLQGHADPPIDVLKKFGIPPADLQRGVRCPHCHSFLMRRAHATWICNRCGQSSKNAHEQSILNHFLLFGPTMTNKQCREFLKIEDRQLIRRLLKNMKFQPSGSGTGNGLYYKCPTHEWLDQYHRDHLLRK